MQTFLPYPDFGQSVRSLDYRRLGKQRVEAKQILNVLTNRTQKRGWANHPAVKMWKGYEHALALYMNACIIEWTRRGYKNNMELAVPVDDAVMPPWLGDEKFHASHRSNLIRKDPIFYGKWEWNEGPELPYFWPSNAESSSGR